MSNEKDLAFAIYKFLNMKDFCHVTVLRNLNMISIELSELFSLSSP